MKTKATSNKAQSRVDFINKMRELYGVEEQLCFHGYTLIQITGESFKTSFDILGTYKTEEDSLKAYDSAVAKYKRQNKVTKKDWIYMNNSRKSRRFFATNTNGEMTEDYKKGYIFVVPLIAESSIKEMFVVDMELISKKTTNRRMQGIYVSIEDIEEWINCMKKSCRMKTCCKSKFRRKSDNEFVITYEDYKEIFRINKISLES